MLLAGCLLLLAADPVSGSAPIASAPEPLPGHVEGDPLARNLVRPGETRRKVSKKRFGRPIAAAATRPNVDTFSHARFDALLKRFVDCRGMVCYRDWKADCHAMRELHDYLMAMGAVDTGDPHASAKGELAFFINAYNALVIRAILDEYPTPSIQKHNDPKAAYRIFDDFEMWMDREYLSLNALEHGVLRQLHDPRIHFAIVCAAMGCPRLRNEAYVAERLDEQLTDNARDFFACDERFSICRHSGVVKLSPILLWFREDFGETDREILELIRPFLTPEDQVWVANHPCAKIKHIGYNWALNDRCPTLGVKVGAAPYAAFAKVSPMIRPLIKVVERGPIAMLWSPDGGSPAAEAHETTVGRRREFGAAPVPAVIPKETVPVPPRALRPQERDPSQPAPPRAFLPKCREDGGFDLPAEPNPPRSLTPRHPGDPVVSLPAIPEPPRCLNPRVVRGPHKFPVRSPLPRTAEPESARDPNLARTPRFRGGRGPTDPKEPQAATRPSEEIRRR